MNEIVEFIAKHKVVVICRGLYDNELIKTIRALYDGGIRVAQLGLKNCKDDLTDIFIFLLLHTRENDATWFKKLFASAKRRKNVDMIKIDIAMQR